MPKSTAPKTPCPKCGAWTSTVVDSRPSVNGTRRRRQCACGHRYSTLEIVDIDANRSVQKVHRPNM
jgi:transcriptional regulator NrdR family protein